MSIRLDGRVAVITGSGNGLGKLYALQLASMGAKVVVNDVGASVIGEAKTYTNEPRPADKVAQEIKAKGGIAVANYDSVEEGHKIIDTAIKSFGKIDILINNAGILSDKSLAKMTKEEFENVLKVHLMGTFNCTKAAWPYMQKQQYGRIITVSSAAGLYGNFGQLNYSSAKGALISFSKVIALEGAKRNIHCNCIAPLAATRMTETILSQEMLSALEPHHIATFVAYLVSDACKENGQVFEAGAGWISKHRWNRSKGHVFRSQYTPEDIHKNWDKIVDFTESTFPESNDESIRYILEQVMDPEKIAVKASFGAPKKEANSAKIFKMMGAYLDNFPQEGKKLVQKVDCIFHFEIVPQLNAPPAAVYTVNLKEGNGNVQEGKHSNPDVTFTVTDDDFVAICIGKMNPQVAFLRKKLLATGSVRHATKFTRALFPPLTMKLLEMDSATAINTYLAELKSKDKTSSSATPKVRDASPLLKSAPIFDMIQKHLETPAGNALAQKVNAIYQLEIIPNNGPSQVFCLDLKSSPPKAYKGAASKSDVQFTMSDSDFVDIMQGKLNPQKAFMQGKMKVKGSMAAAMKFNPNLFPKMSHL